MIMNDWLIHVPEGVAHELCFRIEDQLIVELLRHSFNQLCVLIHVLYCKDQQTKVALY